MINHPLVSVVIPTFNQGRFIEQTITSILGQDYPNRELIIIDAGSTDETLDIIKKHSASITYWVSESDNGEGDAINKGFRKAKGDILAWLNSDDMYMPCALAKVAKILQNPSEPGLVYGGVINFSEGRRGASPYWPPDFDPKRLAYQDYIQQPGVFWTRSLSERLGEIDSSYHYVLDWEWYLRASKICSFIPIRDYLAMYRHHTSQKTSGNMDRAAEIMRLVDTYGDEDWQAAYRDVITHAKALRYWLNAANMLKLSNFREFFYPSLYMKHGRERVDSALRQLAM